MENWPNFGAAFDGIGELFQWFKRRGEVCKTFMRRFDPDPRLQIYAVENKELEFIGFRFVLIVC